MFFYFDHFYFTKMKIGWVLVILSLSYFCLCSDVQANQDTRAVLWVYIILSFLFSK